MPSQDDVHNQMELLLQYRRNLSHLLKQQSYHGGYGDTPLHILNGIEHSRNEIRRIKINLRQWGVEVEDLPEDEESTVGITIVIRGNIRAFSDSKLQKFLDELAKELEIDPSQIEVPYVRPGSIRISIKLPPEAAERLVSKHVGSDAGLKRLGIEQILIDTGRDLSITIPSQISYSTIEEITIALHRLAQQADYERWSRTQQEKIYEALALAESLVYEIRRGRPPRAEFFETIKELSQLLIRLGKT